ncbi:MAG: carboxypeptidase-like regulatory domain-containing protein [Acidobacteriota bacterium]
MLRRCGSLLTGFLIIYLFSTLTINAQARGTGTISGKVSLGGKPGKGVPVTASLSDNTFPPKPAAATATTDDEGHFKLSGLAAGRYTVAPYQPKEVIPGSTRWESGQTITLTDGEVADKVDFDLSRGGVITGRVTGPDGRPLVEQRVTIESATDPKTNFGGMMGTEMYQTDDRGIFRIYGLPAGKYVVSVGEEKDGSTQTYGMGQGGYYPRTFHPGVVERSEAKVIELSEGGEEAAIDITLGPREKTYSISGRMVDEATGDPAPDVSVGYGKIKPGETSVNNFGSSSKSDVQGKFRIEGIKPGNYAIFVAAFGRDNDDAKTSDPVQVQITDGDIADIEVKVRQGISIDGTVVVEGNPDPAALAKVPQLTVAAWGRSSGQISAPNYRSSKIAADDSFHFKGLAAGKLGFILSGRPDSPQGFTLLRVEQNGSPSASHEIDLLEGAASVNVRLVLAYGTGSIRGQITIVGGTLPPTARVWASAHGAGQDSGHGVPVDARGRFWIENLPAGEYMVSVFADLSGTGTGGTHSGESSKVSVSNANETNVMVILDLAPKQPGGIPQ